MYESVRRELPEFLNTSLVYCDTLTLSRDQRTCLVLTQQLQFLEFQRKQLLRSINLKETCLKQVAQRLQNYSGPKSKWYEEGEEKSSSTAMDNPAITFGKFVYRRFDVKKLYIFIKCWNKFVVLERCEHDWLLTCEHEGIQGFRLVHSPIKYYALVELQFENGETRKTNFNQSGDTSDNKLDASQQPNGRHLKKIVEQVRNAKTELQMHKAITEKEFQLLRQQQTFGCNFLRHWTLEEKQILVRCGDVWLRFTHNDQLIVGIPLINNASPPNIKILKRLQPLLHTVSDAVTSCLASLNYEFSLFKLKQSFETLETVESFFESEDPELQANTWVKDSTNTLLPEGTAVFLLKINVNQLVQLKKCSIFLQYDVEKALSDNKLETYQQHIYIKTLDVDEILVQRQLYELSFKPATLHQDFLAIAASSVETQLLVQYASLQDVVEFEKLLVNKFQCKLLERQLSNMACNDDDADDAMEVEQSYEHTGSTPRQLLIYNGVAHSMWHGLLLMRSTDDADVSEANSQNLKHAWKIYTPTNEKLCLLLRILFNDLLAVKCNISAIECFQLSRRKNNEKLNIIEFENALRMELKELLEKYNRRGAMDKNKEDENTIRLMELQLESDLLAMKLKNKS